MTRALLVAVLSIALMTIGQTPAAAGGVKAIIAAGGPLHHGVHHFKFQQPFHQFHRPFHRPPVSGVFSSPVVVHPHPVVIVPRPVVIVTSSPCQWTAGYWTYQWIPQSYTYQVWVPDGWLADGSWGGGHSELRTVSTGHYQPVWVAPRCVP